MLARENRLNKKDFENVFRKSRTLKEDFLILKVAKNNLNQTRFGFVVSQKISKKANVRNKVKRRLRELVGLKIEKIKKGIDIVLISLPGIEKKDFPTINENLDKLLKKTGI